MMAPSLRAIRSAACLLVALLASSGTASPLALPRLAMTVEAVVKQPSLRATSPGLGLYVALGDSISAGKYADSFGQTFPALVAQQLGTRLVVVARSGAMTDWALPRIGAIEATHPALVTIELGTNDAGGRVPIDAFAGRYDSIVAALAGPDTQVLCLGSWLPAAGYDAAIRMVCARHGGTFVSLRGFYAQGGYHALNGHPTFSGAADWFHPGDLGHAAIATRILNLLERATAGRRVFWQPSSGPLPF